MINVVAIAKEIVNADADRESARVRCDNAIVKLRKNYTGPLPRDGALQRDDYVSLAHAIIAGAANADAAPED